MKLSKKRLKEKVDRVIAGVDRLRDYLSPEWIRDYIMFDRKHNSLVISPQRCLEHGVTAINIAQDKFASRTILHFRLDYNLKKVKR